MYDGHRPVRCARAIAVDLKPEGERSRADTLDPQLDADHITEPQPGSMIDLHPHPGNDAKEINEPDAVVELCFRGLDPTQDGRVVVVTSCVRVRPFDSALDDHAGSRL